MTTRRTSDVTINEHMRWIEHLTLTKIRFRDFHALIHSTNIAPFCLELERYLVSREMIKKVSNICA